METTICIIVTVLCGVLFLIPTIAVFKMFFTFISDISIKEAPFLAIVLIVLFGSFCMLCASGSVTITYTMADAFFGKPKPENIRELHKDGEKYIQYEVPTHKCNAGEKDSDHFICMIPADREVSRYDICQNCNNRYANHLTFFAHGLFQAMENASTYP